MNPIKKGRIGCFGMDCKGIHCRYDHKTGNELKREGYFVTCPYEWECSNSPFVFCPLINAKCRVDCEAFRKTEVYNRSQFNDVDSYTYRGGYCQARVLHEGTS